MTLEINRRTFLRGVGLGSAALTLPLLGADPIRAAGEFPKRFVVFFSPNGTVRENWSPDGTETDFTLSRILDPLTPHKSDVVVLEGLDITIISGAPGDGHQQGMGQILTANELNLGDTMGGCDSCAPVSLASSISIDQRIANAIGTDTARRSFEFGINAPEHEDVWTRMCYRGSEQALPPQSDPAAAFRALFADVFVDPDPFGEAERAAWRHRQVVDFAHREYTSIRDRLGTDDRARIEAHIEGLDDIARRLDNPTSIGAACVIPEEDGTGIDYRLTENYPMVGQLQMDMLVSAFACDVTRVASLQWDHSVGNQTFPWLGITTGHHTISHEEDITNPRELLTQINTWYAEQLAYLIQKMKDVPEGGGTMLDNTAIVWVNELGDGASHTRSDIPIVLAGSAGGHYRTGRYLSYDRQPHSDLWVTMCQAYGIDTSTFGNPSYCNGPLARLT